MGERGVRAQLRPPPPPPGAAALSGRGGTSPLPWGGWRAGAAVARGPEGEIGGRGEAESRRGSPPPSSRGAGLWPPAQTPFLRRRILPRYTCSAGVVWQPRVPGEAWPAAAGSA